MQVSYNHFCEGQLKIIEVSLEVLRGKLRGSLEYFKTLNLIMG